MHIILTYIHTYVFHYNICQQIFSEFNRIFEREIIRDIWLETKPKIFDVTKVESNAKLRSLYEESITCTSEGMARYLYT